MLSKDGVILALAFEQVQFMYCPSRGPMLPHSCEEFNNRIQAMDDTDYAKAIKAADGDVSKMPHYNFDVTIDPNIPASK